jgi:hypothetical protein
MTMGTFLQFYAWLLRIKGGFGGSDNAVVGLNKHALYMTISFFVLLLMGGIIRFIVQICGHGSKPLTVCFALIFRSGGILRWFQQPGTNVFTEKLTKILAFSSKSNPSF